MRDRTRKTSPGSADGRTVAAWTATPSGGGHLVLPGGCRDVLILQEEGEPPCLVLTGLDIRPRRIHAARSTLYAGIRLLPGATLRSGAPLSRAGDPIFHTARFALRSPLPSIWDRDDDVLPFLHNVVERWLAPADSLVTEFLHSLEARPDVLPRLGMNERTLRRRLKDRTGTSPRFWTQLRRARRRLLSTNDPIVGGAIDCGYSDHAHLTREMRRWFGTTLGGLRNAAAPAVRRLLLERDAFAP